MGNGSASGLDFDLITDFEIGVDKIDLSGIDANLSLAGDQAFTFTAGATQFTGQAGELIVLNGFFAGVTRPAVAIDLDGDLVLDGVCFVDTLEGAFPSAVDLIL